MVSQDLLLEGPEGQASRPELQPIYVVVALLLCPLPLGNLGVEVGSPAEKAGIRRYRQTVWFLQKQSFTMALDPHQWNERSTLSGS